MAKKNTTKKATNGTEKAGSEGQGGEGMTRIDAARFLGTKTVEGVRYLERTGKLHPEPDAEGINRFDIGELEQVKAEREAEGRPVRLEAAEVKRVTRAEATIAHGMQVPKRLTKQQPEDVGAFYDAVNAKNEATRAAYVRDHISADDATKVLGIHITERNTVIGKLVRRGLLVPVPSPCRLVVEGGYTVPLREVEGYAFFYKHEFYFRREQVTALAATWAAMDKEGKIVEDRGIYERYRRSMRDRYGNWPE